MRNRLAVWEPFVSDVEYIFWDAYDKMAPVEYRKKTRDDQLRQRDGPGLESRYSVRNHAFGTQHRGIDSSSENHRLGGHSEPIRFQSAAPSRPSMELFEDFSPASCSSDHYSAVEPSEDRQVDANAELFLEPEMLPQVKERPMSHEALELEVKKIYAKIYAETEMVDARCVDIGIPEYDATTKDIVSEALTIRDSRSSLLSGLQEKPLYDNYDFSADIQSLTHTSISKTNSGTPRISHTHEPSIASEFGDFGLVLAFTIIRFFGQESRPTNTEKETRNAVEVLKNGILTNCWWQSLIAIHHRLLHEHHKLFFAFNHSTASLASKKLAANYSGTPAAFGESWTKCLEDLQYYRMAIDDDEPSISICWSDVAQFYNNATDSSHDIGRPWVNDYTKSLHEKLDDRLKAHDSTTLITETNRICPVRLKKSQTGRIRKRPLRVAQLEGTDQHPLSPAAVNIKGLDCSKTDISVNYQPWSSITSNLKDLDHSRQCISIHTKNLGLSPRSLSPFGAFSSNVHSTILPAPVPCTRWKGAFFVSRSMRSYRCIRPCHVLIALGFITIVGSLAPAIWRSTNRNDISGGFSLGQYILGAGVFVIGSIVMIHSKKCTCWDEG